MEHCASDSSVENSGVSSSSRWRWAVTVVQVGQANLRCDRKMNKKGFISEDAIGICGQDWEQGMMLQTTHRRERTLKWFIQNAEQSEGERIRLTDTQSTKVYHLKYLGSKGNAMLLICTKKTKKRKCLDNVLSTSDITSERWKFWAWKAQKECGEKRRLSWRHLKCI